MNGFNYIIDPLQAEACSGTMGAGESTIVVVQDSGMGQRKRPTVADVAARANVSVGTVSNVLSGTTRVSPETRQRVLDAVAALDYRQNMLAQGLRSNRTPIVGVCVPHTSIAYFSELVDAFEDVASDNNFAIMQVLSRQDPQKEYVRLKSLMNYRLGGLIWVPTMAPDASYALLRQHGLPTVVVDRAPEGNFEFDKVTFDNRGAMRRAGMGLLQRGHRSILFVVHQRLLNVTIQRIAGLEDAAATIPDPVAVKVVECADQSALTAGLAASLRKRDRPTAVIVSNSKLASWLYRALRDLGLACPHDISIVAFDEPEWADIVSPPLSVVRQPTRDIALMAWHLLLNRMAGEVETEQQIQLQAEVVFRDSVRDFNAG